MKRTILLTVAMLLLLVSCNLSTTKNETTMEQKIGKDFGEKYAAAWSEQDANAHANLFAANGSQIVNNGTPAVGRDAIAKVAQDDGISGYACSMR
ncbi:MAG TPA: hypothetical protein VFI29_13950 [Hanamia sp.]|nr:hypothetical protein [Hanamia sp.]